MFGVVPKPLWNRVAPSDEHNRIQLDTNCLIFKSGSEIVLVDSGYGVDLSDREQDQMATQGDSLATGLSSIGIATDDVTHVITSHLHFDHANGLTHRSENHWGPTFANARHLFQEAEWDDAMGNLPELAGNYFPERLSPLESAGLVDIIKGEQQVLENVFVHPTGGHTRGHQAIEFKLGDSFAIYLGDLCPTSAHLKTFWTMAYDQSPLETRRTKPHWLQRIVEQNGLLLFDHDPNYVAGTLRLNERGQIELAKGISRQQFNAPGDLTDWLR